MHIDWDQIRWLQDAHDLSNGERPTPNPLVKAALSLFTSSDERPVVIRSSLTDELEDWTLMATDANALVHVRLSYSPPRESTQGREGDRAEEKVHELKAVRVPLRDVAVEILAVPAAEISHLEGKPMMWRTDFLVTANAANIEERFDVPGMDQDYSKAAAEAFLASLVASLATV